MAKHVAVDQEAPHGHWKTITLVVGLRHDGMVTPFVIDGPMNGTIFLAYVEQCLAPTLDRCDVVIMDNLPASDAPSARLFRAAERRPLRGRGRCERAINNEKSSLTIHQSAHFLSK